MKSFLFNLLSGGVGGAIGHRNLVRTGAFLMRAGRQDMPNRIAANGEVMVQSVILGQLEGDDAVIIDCGANVGQWATQLVATSRALGRKTRLRLFCFEPSAHTYGKLAIALGRLQATPLRLLPIHNALSSIPDTVSLKIVHDGAGTNSLVDVPGSYASEETVSVTTLDDFTAENSIETIAFLKIDAEGHDFEVILGSEQLLDEQRIGVIQFEYNWRWIYGKHFLQEVFEYLDQRDYSIGKITPAGIQFYSHYDVQLESFVEVNYLACTQEWKPRFKQVPSWLD